MMKMIIYFILCMRMKDLTNSIAGAYHILIDLFREWVFNELANIDFTRVQRLRKKTHF